MLRLARVLRVYPGPCADIRFEDTEQGGYAARVPVMAGGAGGDTGGIDLPEPELSGTPEAVGRREMIAVVGMVSGSPLIMGFVQPPIRQGVFGDGRMVYRHASDTYFTIDKDGNAELAHPSGSFVRFGTPGHEDLTGKDVDGAWAIQRNTSSTPTLTIGVSAGGTSKSTITISPDGAVSLSSEGSVAVSSQGPVSVTTPSSVAIAGASGVTIGGGGGDVTVQDCTLRIENGDVIADGVSLKLHPHIDTMPQPGALSGLPLATED